MLADFHLMTNELVEGKTFFFTTGLNPESGFTNAQLHSSTSVEYLFSFLELLISMLCCYQHTHSFSKISTANLQHQKKWQQREHLNKF